MGIGWFGQIWWRRVVDSLFMKYNKIGGIVKNGNRGCGMNLR